MTALRVRIETSTDSKGWAETLFRATTPSGDVRVRFATPMSGAGHAPPAAAGDAALAIFLLPAMRMGVPLEVASPASAKLAPACDQLQEIFSCWFPELYPRPVPVRADWVEAAPQIRRGGKACCFTAGVDSLFSVFKHRAGLESLLFVHGFDVPLEDVGLRARVAAGLRSAADCIGLPLVEFETDVRAFSEEWVIWTHFCGPALAATGHLAAHRIGDLIIPASATYANLEPVGTHLYTDPLWSGDAVGFVHDGAEAKRIDKIRAIMHHPAGRKHLRVCWQNLGGESNCGRCEKCLQTLANLRALGLDGQCEAFPAALDLEALRVMEIDHPIILPAIIETLDTARAAGDTDLESAITDCICSSSALHLGREIGPLRDFLMSSPAWRKKTVPRFRDAVFGDCLERHPDWTSREVASLVSRDPDEALALLWRKSKWWLMGQIALDLLFPRQLRRLLGIAKK